MSRVSAAGPKPDAAPVFAALGDATRLRLVRRLSDGAARSITDLTSGSQLTRQAVTKHLRVLEDAGLVRHQRSGRERRFSLVPTPIENARSCLDEISAQWEDALQRLKSFVESDPHG